MPANTRTMFVRTQDEKVRAIIVLGGIDPDRDYEIRFRLFDPDGNMRVRGTVPYHTHLEHPPNFTLTAAFNWAPIDPATWQLGR